MMEHVFWQVIWYQAWFKFAAVMLELLPWVALVLVVLALTAVPGVLRSWRRRSIIHKLERQRGSKVIAMIHRSGGMLRMITGGGMIGLDEAENMLKVVRDLPADKPIDLILHTPGGMVLSTAQIARALKNHPATVRVIVPHWAMSGGTFLSLAADEIIMDKNAVLGPVDPQTVRLPGGMLPMASVLRVIREKSKNEIDDETWILADQAEMAIRQITDHIAALLRDRFGAERAAELGRIFTAGRWTHDYPLTCDELHALGMKVSTEVPKEAYELLEAFPTGSRFRSVQWLRGRKRKTAESDRDPSNQPTPSA